MRKKTPETSKLTRSNVLPYARTSGSASDKNLVVAKPDKSSQKAAPKLGDGPKSATSNESPVTIEPSAAPHDVDPPVHDDAPALGDGPKSATRNEPPTEPEPPQRDTMAMLPVMPIGAPPAVPAAAGAVEEPTFMPGPRAIPDGEPTDPALPPGDVPSGDSRSFRRADEFALVYRQANAVIMRFGIVGQRGQWRVVEYPTSAAASHAYAKECSRFVAEGFSDYR